LPSSVTVFINHLYESHHIERLALAFPQVDFVRLPKAPPWPDTIEDGEVLLFAGLKKPELSALLQSARNIRWIHTGSAGFDWVSVPEVEARDITISRSADVMSIPMAEFALSVMLEHAKNLYRLHQSQEQHSWEPPMHSELYDKTLLIVGAGAIGQRIGKLAKAFSMQVIGTKRDGQPSDAMHETYTPDKLDSLLPRADYVVLTAPATPETKGMINAKRLALMQPHSYLINLARGALIIEQDLIDALQRQQIAGACLDAFTTEPLPPESPLWDTPNLFVSPHASYRTPDIRKRVFDEFAHNLERYLRGEDVINTMKHPALGY
jgi:phosphoglycerate dehydrogenase-like enzyme